MAIVEKKILKENFDAILSGKKKAERRLQDFEIEEGDTFLLREWDKEKREYTGRELRKIVTHVGKSNPNDDYWSREEVDKYGYQIISLD